MERAAAAASGEGNAEPLLASSDAEFQDYLKNIIADLVAKKKTIESMDLDRPEGNPYDKDASETVIEDYRKYNQIKFYKISHAQLDNEIREITNDPDLLMHLRGGNQDFRATMEFLLLTSLMLTFVFMWAYPS